MEGKGRGKSKDVSRSVSEVGVAVLALVKCECDESQKKKWHRGMGDFKKKKNYKKKLEAGGKPPSPVKAGAVIYNE